MEPPSAPVEVPLAPSVAPSVAPSAIPSAIPLTIYQRLTQMMETSLEFILRKVIFWEKDDKQIGRIARFIHYGFMYCMTFLYILNHTFLPSYLLFIVYYGVFLLIFIHHIICGGCVWTTIEQRLIGDNQCFIDPLLEIFHVPTTSDVSSGVFILLSCLFMGILTLELILRTTLSIQQWFR
jgi:hypothetical protein